MPTDDSGRSSQIFIIEAAERLIAESPQIFGVRAIGELFDARAFLCALSPEPLLVHSDGVASEEHCGTTQGHI